ncbi:hypothetical protein G3N92_27865, partial [Burkholderia sp. Ac-20379]|nr:hypothetical protein [Burkholderia sp. Ac-20379]
MSAQDDVTLEAGASSPADWTRSRTVTWQAQPGRADAAIRPAQAIAPPMTTA